MTNLGFKIGAEQPDEAHSHQNICSALKKRSHVHEAGVLSAPRNSRPADRMNVHDVGQPRGAGGKAIGLVGRAPRIVQIEIVLQVMVRADKQEKAAARG
jgi:hypothetical protein